jgi:hypothetical protein
MLYREIIAVCSQIHTKHISTVCVQKAEFVNVKLVVHIVTTDGTYSEYWDLHGLINYVGVSFELFFSCVFHTFFLEPVKPRAPSNPVKGNKLSFPKPSRTTLDPTQPPSQWLPGLFPWFKAARA